MAYLSRCQTELSSDDMSGAGEATSKMVHSQGNCRETSAPHHMGLSIWLLRTQNLSFLSASGPWESHRVFSWPSRSNRPSLLLYSSRHTSNSDTILGKKLHKGMNTRRQGYWEASWIWALTVMNTQTLWLMWFYTYPQILWYLCHPEAKPNSPPLLNVGCT